MPITHQDDTGGRAEAFDRIYASTISGGVGAGSFVATAAALTTITDADITATSCITIFPSNAAAGLLLRTKTCYIVTGSGSFTFNVSATGAGAPAGTEAFEYIFLRET